MVATFDTRPMCFASSVSLFSSLSRAHALLPSSVHRTQEVVLALALFLFASFASSLPSTLPTTPVFFLLAPLSFRSVFLLSSFRYNPTTFGTRFHSFTWVRRTCVRNCNFPRTSLIETFALLAFSNAYPKISGELVALRFFQRRVILRSFAFL